MSDCMPLRMTVSISLPDYAASPAAIAPDGAVQTRVFGMIRDSA